VLDFGIAKMLQPEATVSGDASTSPTITSPSLVERGNLLGTAAYMSPEQAKGREATRRSDIWAFGAVLYEMLARDRAFKGDDVSETLAAVLRADVDWARIPAAAPAPLRQLVARCLDRDVTRRLRDIGEARIVLDDLAREPRARVSDDVRAPIAKRLVPPLVAAAVAAGVVAALLWPRPQPPSQSVTRFALSIPDEQTLLLDGQSRDLAITPDGTRVVYKGGSRIDRTQLFLYDLDRIGPTPLNTIGMPKGPFASPDGQWIGFFEPGALGAVFKKVPLSGGPALQVSRLDGPSRGATWGDGDVIVAASGATGTGLLQLSPNGGEPTVLTRPDRDAGELDHYWPQFLPGGKAVLFTITSPRGLEAAHVAVLDIASQTWRTILRGASQAHYVDSGHLVYVAGGALWAIAFDLTRLDTIGDGAVVVPQIATLPTGVAEFDLARDGTLVYVASGGARSTPRTMVWVDRRGREEPIPTPPRPYSNVRLSPDGTRIATEIAEDEHDIWVWDLVRQTLTKVTTDPGLDESPVWTADGRRLVFTSQAGGDLGSLFWQAADGSGRAERLTAGALIERATSVLPDGTGVIFSTGRNSSVLTLGGSARETRPLLGQGTGMMDLSPDGRWIAYANFETGTPQIFVSAFANPDGARIQVTPSGGTEPRWSRDGRELFFIGLDGRLMTAPVSAGEMPAIGAPVAVLHQRYVGGPTLLSRAATFDVSPDGRRFVMLKQSGGDGQPPEPATVVVVKNWVAELQRTVPTQR
jgi:eukaryotic-like serine/threonine-protein kinase